MPPFRFRVARQNVSVHADPTVIRGISVNIAADWIALHEGEICVAHVGHSAPRPLAPRSIICHSASQIFAGILVVVLMLPCLEISGARAQIPRLAIICLA